MGYFSSSPGSSQVKSEDGVEMGTEKRKGKCNGFLRITASDDAAHPLFAGQRVVVHVEHP
ncbi:hypothetical protein GLOTRDRAFT_100923 [Gloeophyllum trabeum ATCC 11539]|uniref:Uncharacterized protein n=1 Tax=Gloeophyllum trabeum (strain ATCC 11539 / FP-39264 / Madison 617) TaxID=670483 RepID=S7Q0B2_GLOTA|nr:uncharacterized protein GLOTRDRAFT_100923 [Gloeophyllum trabeum ATCC 11539]EPQ53356.1 hypothetical protein GLOTRDRAFT_100923 [Gloeophyllum trabeum ATCC 11539]